MNKGLLLLVMLALSGCEHAQPIPINPVIGGGEGAAQTALNANYQRWQQAGIHDYRYEFQRSCYCMQEFVQPVLITVKNDLVVDARFKESNLPLPDDFEDNQQAVPYLFEKIQDAINRNAASINVDYDAQYGYPANISIDYDTRMADEELYLTARELVF